MNAAAPPAIEITGVRTSPGGEVVLVEVEARAGGTRLAFGQVAPSPLPGSSLHGLSVDGVPAALVALGEQPGALVLHGGRPHLPLPAVQEGSLSGFSEEALSSALSPVLPLFADGLYSVTRASLPAARAPGPHFVSGRAEELQVLDPGVLASDEGVPVAADLAGGFYLLLGGRGALERGEPAVVLSAGFLVEADGFTARRHDRSAREAFARSPRHLFDDVALRDAFAAHRARYPKAETGPLSEDRLEPAAQLARAVLADLSCEEALDFVSALRRVPSGRTTEFRVDVRVHGASFEVALITDDGRRLGEAVVKSGVRYRATGLRPSGRALGRALRQLSREEG